MIRIVHAADLYRRPLLAASMFRDRAGQFHQRLGWNAVRVDDLGLEFDVYDDLNPIYVIVEDEEGDHCASARLLPTTGRTMLGEHFSDLTGGVALSSPLIWEVTRCCVSPRLDRNHPLTRRAPAALFWAGCDLALRSGVDFFVAIYFAHMQRVWKAGGFAPEVLGSRQTPEGEIMCGLWEITPEFRDDLASKAALAGETVVDYFPQEENFTFTPAELRATPIASASELARLL